MALAEFYPLKTPGQVASVTPETVASHPLPTDWIPADGTPDAPVADWMRGLNVRTTYHYQSHPVRSP